MEARYIALAIKKLMPDAEFSFVETDYSSVKWDHLNGDAPSFDDIQKAIEEIKEQESKDVAKLTEAKKIAEDKLVALGLTTDDLKVLGLA